MGFLPCPTCSPHGAHGYTPCPVAGCGCLRSYSASAYLTAKTMLLPTGHDIEGPFYKENAPLLRGPQTLVDYPTLLLSGKITDTDGNPVSPDGKLILDFWQADGHGDYDMAGFTLRGKVVAAYSDRGNTYEIGTVKPGFYKISDPGQPDEFRCSHIHVKLWLDGVEKLSTQLYFANDPHDDTDHWFDIKRCITFSDPTDHTRGTFDFVLAH